MRAFNFFEDSMFKIYLINLKSSHERLKASFENFATIGLTFERIEAIDGHIHSAAEYNKVKTIRFISRELSRGEIGCYLSHLLALKTFIGSGVGYALINEDDIILSQDTARFLNGFIAETEAKGLKWDLLYLSNPLKSRVFSCVYQGHGREVYRSLHLPMGTTATLWTREGAVAFFNSQYSKTIFLPFDYAVRSFSSARGNSFGLNSQFVSLRDVDSVVDGPGPPTRLEKPSRKKRLKNIINRKLFDRIAELKSFLRIVFQR